MSPQCLETLRYSEFQAKMMKKLQQKAGDADIKTTEKNAHENVFRQLMQKIKSLEMNYAIIDMYSAQVANTPCQHTLINSPYQATLSTQPANSPYRHTLSTHPVNTPCQHTLSTPLIKPPYQLTLSTHPIDTIPSKQHNLSMTLSAHIINTTLF